jgi:hypothetical protein
MGIKYLFLHLELKKTTIMLQIKLQCLKQQPGLFISARTTFPNVLWN